MPTDLFLKRTLSGFAPADDQTVDELRKYEVGQLVRVKATAYRGRSYQQLKLYFALIKKVCENLPEKGPQWSKEGLDQIFRISAGHYIVTVMPDNTINRRAASIAFDSMDQNAFNVFMNSTVALICKDIIPNMPEDDLKAELMEMIET